MIEEAGGPTPPGQQPPPPDLMPRWVPVAIGIVLVSLATLAVITGLRYRDNTLVDIVRPRSDRPATADGAPPGEPEPGGSLIGSAVPQANEPVGGETRAQISGGAGGVTSVVRMSARRGMQVKSVPADAVVYVNNVAVGRAREFDAEDEVYDFAEPGSYNVRLVAPGFKERHFVVTAGDQAQQDIVRIDVKLEKGQ